MHLTNPSCTCKPKSLRHFLVVHHDKGYKDYLFGQPLSGCASAGQTEIKQQIDR